MGKSREELQSVLKVCTKSVNQENQNENYCFVTGVGISLKMRRNKGNKIMTRMKEE